MMHINGEAFFSESEIEARHGLAALDRIKDSVNPPILDTLLVKLQHLADELGQHGVDTAPIKGVIAEAKATPVKRAPVKISGLFGNSRRYG